MTGWKNMGRKLGLGVALAASALTVAAPADAQRYGYRGGYGYRHGGHGGDVAAGALLGGIVGLGIGAAIVGNHRDRYYDRGYAYDDRGYYPRDHYVYDNYEYNYRPRCFVERRYDEYYGRPYNVRVCR